MLILGIVKPADFHPPATNLNPIPMKKWKYANLTSVMMIAALISIYITLSPAGIADPAGIPQSYPFLIAAVWAVALMLIYWMKRRHHRSLSAAT